jgi:hypothetical protein
MNKKLLIQAPLYILCLYNIYLYLPDALDLFGIDIYPPEIDSLMYFDAAMLLFGGGILGWILIKSGSKFNKCLGWTMVAPNVLLVPVFIFRAIP